MILHYICVENLYFFYHHIIFLLDEGHCIIEEAARKSTKVVTISVEGGAYPISLVFGGKGAGLFVTSFLG